MAQADQGGFMFHRGATEKIINPPLQSLSSQVVKGQHSKLNTENLSANGDRF